MSRRSIVLAATLILLAVAGGAWWRAAGRIDANNPAQVARGAAVYRAHCAACHGVDLRGELDWQIRRPSGELPAPPHDASGHTWHHSDEQLFGIVKHGIARYAPPDYKTAMPSFVGTLSDADIRAAIAFIKSTWPEDIRARQDRLNRR